MQLRCSGSTTPQGEANVCVPRSWTSRPEESIDSTTRGHGTAVTSSASEVSFVVVGCDAGRVRAVPVSSRSTSSTLPCQTEQPGWKCRQATRAPSCSKAKRGSGGTTPDSGGWGESWSHPMRTPLPTWSRSRGAQQGLMPDQFHVRWSRPLEEPLPAARGSGGRRPLLPSEPKRVYPHEVLRHRAAAEGLVRISSSAVRLHRHQVTAAQGCYSIPSVATYLPMRWVSARPSRPAW